MGFGCTRPSQEMTMHSIAEALNRPSTSEPQPARLAARFPEQFPDGPVGWIAGWATILTRLAVEAETLGGSGETVRWQRFKEKYGVLRVDYTGPEAVRASVARAVAQSRTTCQVCGEAGHHHSLGSTRLTVCRLHLLAALAERNPGEAAHWLHSPHEALGEAPMDRPATAPEIDHLIGLALNDHARAAQRCWAAGRHPDDATRRMLEQAESRGIAVTWLGRRSQAATQSEVDEVAVIDMNGQDKNTVSEWRRQAKESASLMIRTLPACDVHAPLHASEPLLAARVAFNV